MSSTRGGAGRAMAVSAALAAAALVLAGCASAPTGPRAVATFRVGSETFKVQLIGSALIQQAKDLEQGTGRDTVPLGDIVRGSGGVNAPWTWHIDPTTFHFAYTASGSCNGSPSQVQDRALSAPYYCPADAKVVSVR